MKRLFFAAAVLAGTLATTQAHAACGKVTIADMNWASATLIAHVDSFILKHGYGCDTEIVTGDTMPTGTSMSRSMRSPAISWAVSAMVSPSRSRIGLTPSLADFPENIIRKTLNSADWVSTSKMTS